MKYPEIAVPRGAASVVSFGNRNRLRPLACRDSSKVLISATAGAPGAFRLAKRALIDHPCGMIEGLSHITLVVSDLAKTKVLIETVFQGREIYSSDGQQFSLSPEKFFLVGGLWIAIMEGRPLAEKTYNHIAFKVAESDLQSLKGRVVSLGLEVRESRSRVDGEGSSVYFYDYDNHLFELHTGTLETRLARYAKGAKICF